MLTPEDGIPAGSLFGYGPHSLNQQLWTKDQGTFSLGLDGDNIFLYCLDRWKRTRFLSGFSNTGSWKPPFLEESEYGQNSSSLAPSLTNNTVTLPHKKNYYYNGERDARIHLLRRNIRVADMWAGDDELRFSISTGIHQVQTPSSALSKPSSFMMSLLGALSVVYSCS